jgi:hypothetical protein
MQGTVGVLQSALLSPTVKAVVVTSSFGSVFDPKFGWRAGYTYSAVRSTLSMTEHLKLSEHCYCRRTQIQLLLKKLHLLISILILILSHGALTSHTVPAKPLPNERHGYVNLSVCTAPGFLTICTSVQDFHKTHSPSFSLTMVLPTYIGGPNILPLSKGVDSLSFSQGLLWKTATDSSKLPNMDFPGWVDVRDVAKAHVNALVTPEAAGKRWIVSAGLVTYSDVRSFYSVVYSTQHAQYFSRLPMLSGGTSPPLTPRPKFRP